MVQRYRREWDDIEQTAMKVDRAARGQAPLRYETYQERSSLITYANYIADSNSFPVTVDGKVIRRWYPVSAEYVEGIVERQQVWLTWTEFARALGGIRDLTSEEVHEGPAPRPAMAVVGGQEVSDPWA